MKGYPSERGKPSKGYRVGRGIVLCTSRAGSSPSSPGVPRVRVRSSPLETLGGSRVLAGAVAAWAPLWAPSATSHRTRENIYRCSRYMASGNKPTVFIFKWRVFNFCLVISKEKGNMQRHPDSSGLESGGASSRLVNNTSCNTSTNPIRKDVAPARHQLYLV